MANYTIGDMIYENRIARGYSQEELSFGICSTSSLSRIENNEQTPGRRIFEALTQRLGISDSLYNAYISKDEMEINQLVQQLVWSLERIDVKESETLIRELDKRISDIDFLNKQYLLFAQSCIMREKNEDFNKVLHTLMEAIRLTIPNFDVEEGIRRRLLTFHEITIIENIATCICHCGDQRIGLNLQIELMQYLENHIIDEEEKAQKYPFIVYNITTRLGRMGEHEYVYKLAEKAISCCIEHNKLSALPYLIVNKGYAAFELNRKEEAKELLVQAYVLFKICKKEEHADQLRNDVLQNFNFIIS